MTTEHDLPEPEPKRKTPKAYQTPELRRVDVEETAFGKPSPSFAEGMTYFGGTAGPS